MNYEKAYNQLCSSRKSRRLQKEVGYEIHHIVPTSLGGSNESSNLVKLTCREHYLAHWLLYKIYKNAPMAAAWKFMCEGNDKQNAKSKIVTSRRYERARIAHSKSLKGTKQSESTISKRIQALTGLRRSTESIKRYSESKKGELNPCFKHGRGDLWDYLDVLYVIWLQHDCPGSRRLGSILELPHSNLVHIHKKFKRIHHAYNTSTSNAASSAAGASSGSCTNT